METNKKALIIGASRGLGFALVQEFLTRSWRVTATVRKEGTPLHALCEEYPGSLSLEHVDITDSDQIKVLAEHLNGRRFDLLFVNAGVTNDRYETIGEVSTEEFVRVMTTNALGPMRVVEQLADNVVTGGIIGIMSSGQGSVTDNERGEFEVYRASKAALNTLMRSFAARHTGEHSLLLLAPGWVKTDMGGQEARFAVEDVISPITDTIIAQQGKHGLRYLDRFGKPVRW